MPKPNTRHPVVVSHGQLAGYVSERVTPRVWREATPKHVSFSLKFRFER